MAKPKLKPYFLSPLNRDKGDWNNYYALMNAYRVEAFGESPRVEVANLLADTGNSVERAQELTRLTDEYLGEKKAFETFLEEHYGKK